MKEPMRCHTSPPAARAPRRTSTPRTSTPWSPPGGRRSARPATSTRCARPSSSTSPGARRSARCSGPSARCRPRRAGCSASGSTGPGPTCRLPCRVPPRGSVHPINRTIDEAVDIFLGLGYRVAEGPEVETDWYNFEALNFTPYHPARSMQDSLAVDGTGPGGSPLVLRTQTSPVQVRTMLAGPPPVYVVTPGRCYRADTPDTTHIPVFHQIEVLAVDDGITMGDLKGTMLAFARAYFGAEREIRLRPSYFPFTEPSAEVDVSCFLCGGRGCRTCHGQGWIELLGCGMVHPDVLRAGGYDPDKVSGFAAGTGMERPYMLRSGLADLRTLTDNDLRWLASV